MSSPIKRHIFKNDIIQIRATKILFTKNKCITEDTLKNICIKYKCDTKNITHNITKDFIKKYKHAFFDVLTEKIYDFINKDEQIFIKN